MSNDALAKRCGEVSTVASVKGFAFVTAAVLVVIGIGIALISSKGGCKCATRRHVTVRR
jgi:hypothetical protein